MGSFISCCKEQDSGDDHAIPNDASTISKWSALLIPDEGDPPTPYGLNQSVNREKKSGVVSAAAWKLHQSLIHPENNEELPVGKWIAQRDDLGIALSGGGLRAASCTLGW